MHRIALRYLVRALVLSTICVSESSAGTFFGHPDGSISGGLRWDAAPRIVDGNERSLVGSLRYSLEGGSYEAFRDLISWNTVPTVPAFQAAIEAAFAAWESPDRVTGLSTDLSFVADFNTPVVGTGEFGSGDPDGAEIDILVADAGFTNLRAVVDLGTLNSPVTLTSGTAAYAGSSAITGADIIFNGNAGATYSIDTFRRLLTHEIGHALGIGDVDTDDHEMQFLDDDFNGATSDLALQTLTNSWALRVNLLDPAASPLSMHLVPDADPGVDTPGVDILMESGGLGISPTNPITNLLPLRNDDYGMRQFLYPSDDFLFMPGDFNRDGFVDTGDYLTWRDGLGNPFVKSDYNIWQAHYRGTAGFATKHFVAIPESSAATLVGVLFLSLAGVHAIRLL